LKSIITISQTRFSHKLQPDHFILNIYLKIRITTFKKSLIIADVRRFSNKLIVKDSLICEIQNFKLH